MTHDEPTARPRPDAAAIERGYMAAMFCWSMAIDADIKHRKCVAAGDIDGANRWALTRSHYLKNYTRIQYED